MVDANLHQFIRSKQEDNSLKILTAQRLEPSLKIQSSSLQPDLHTIKKIYSKGTVLINIDEPERPQVQSAKKTTLANCPSIPPFAHAL